MKNPWSCSLVTTDTALSELPPTSKKLSSSWMGLLADCPMTLTTVFKRALSSLFSSLSFHTTLEDVSIKTDKLFITRLTDAQVFWLNSMSPFHLHDYSFFHSGMFFLVKRINLSSYGDGGCHSVEEVTVGRLCHWRVRVALWSQQFLASCKTPAYYSAALWCFRWYIYSVLWKPVVPAIHNQQYSVRSDHRFIRYEYHNGTKSIYHWFVIFDHCMPFIPFLYGCIDPFRDSDWDWK